MKKTPEEELWDVLRPPTVLNRGIAISDLQDVAKETSSVIQITVTPKEMHIDIREFKA